MAAGLVLALTVSALLIQVTPAQASQHDDRVQATFLIESEWVRVRLAAQKALDTNSPEVIREFLRYGQYLAAAMDMEEQAILRLTGEADSAGREAQLQRIAAEGFLARGQNPQHATASATSARAAAEAARAAAGRSAEAVDAAVATELTARTEEHARLWADWAFRTAGAKAANTAEDAQLAVEAQGRRDNPEPYPTDQQIAADRQRTYQYQATGGPHVQSSAARVLMADDPLLVRSFLAEGVFAAEELDNRVLAYWLLDSAGSETRVGVDVALDGTREMLRTLAKTDQFRFADQDREKAALVSGIQERISISKGLAAQAESDAAAAEAAAVAAAALPVGALTPTPGPTPPPASLAETGGSDLNAGFLAAGTSYLQPVPAEVGETADLSRAANPAGPLPAVGRPASGSDAEKPAARADAPQAAETRAGQGSGFPFWTVLLGLGAFVVVGGLSALLLIRRRSPV